jgi:SNF2 family DNA or RNA helicase
MDTLLTKRFTGLLADTMGLGKTMQILATIVGNPPNSREGDSGTTLIVMPSTIIEQWKTEIDRFLPDGVSSPVVHYKSSMGMKADFVRCAKIVLTSYHEVCASYPYPNAQMLKAFSSTET